MSQGSTAQWRKSHGPKKVSTSNSSRVCYQEPGSSRAYCGRRLYGSTTVPGSADCPDCTAALHADGKLTPAPAGPNLAQPWIVRNAETGRIESTLLPEAEARRQAAAANQNLHTDAHRAEPWKEHRRA